MIKARVLRDSTLTALSGSIVLVSECQFKALGDNVEMVIDDAPKATTDNKAEESTEKPKTKRTTKK